jgi:hypothetical protein
LEDYSSASSNVFLFLEFDTHTETEGANVAIEQFPSPKLDTAEFLKR